MRSPLLLATILLFYVLSHAQEYSYVHYEHKDGLAGSVVYTMVQDRDGFIWFGTETGLSRFDGTHFKNFTNKDGLPDNEIVRLFVDSRNRVWILPFKNSLCYYLNGTFHTKENDTLLKQLQFTTEIISIKENKKGELAICDNDNLYIVSPGNSVKKVGVANPASSDLFAGGLGDNDIFTFILLEYNGYVTQSHLVELRNDRFIPLQDFMGYYPNTSVSVFLSKNLTVIRKRKDLVFFAGGSRTPTFKFPMPEGFINLSGLNDSCIAITSSSGVHKFNFRRNKTEAFF